MLETKKMKKKSNIFQVKKKYFRFSFLFFSLFFGRWTNFLQDQIFFNCSLLTCNFLFHTYYFLLIFSKKSKKSKYPTYDLYKFFWPKITKISKSKKKYFRIFYSVSLEHELIFCPARFFSTALYCSGIFYSAISIFS